MKQTFTPKQYLAEFALGLIAFFGLYLIMAWSSYSPIDNAWTVAGYQTTPVNKAGALGAWLIDLFLSLFGYVGNFLPFLCVIVPIYLIRTKTAQQFAWKAFILRLVSFALLLAGLTILVQFSFSNSPYYLAGGVLGGWLSAAFVPYLGEFGLLLFATCATVIGFVGCSGAVLIRLLIRFYRWLTLNNQAEQALDTSLQSAQAYPISAEPTIKKPAENTLVNLANFARSEQQGTQPDPLVSPDNATQTPQPYLTEGQLTDANGEHSQAEVHLPEANAQGEHLTPTAQVAISDPTTPSPHLPIEQTALDLNRALTFDFQTASDTELPRVSISEDYNMQNPQAYDQQTPHQHSELAPRAENLSPEWEAMPQVRLNATFEQPAQASHLAQDPPTAQAKVANEPEPRLPNQTEPLLAENEAIADNEETSEVNSPAYKPYAGSLIHPLLQPTPTQSHKPTTPMPTLDLLDQHLVQENQISEEQTAATGKLIMQKLQDFGVKATVKYVLVGPVVTRYELELQPGVKASKVTNIDRDLARALSFHSIRVAEVIPGKPYIGIEVPNQQRQVVWLRNVLNSSAFLQSKHLLPVALGKDISGKPIVIDLAKTPHLLVAGSTGSGKSVGVNTMILSLLFKVKPDQVKFIMIDPKVVELSIYNDIPHLLTPVVTDMNKAANALRWCVDEMERRYQLLSKLYVRNIEGYNEKIDQAALMNLPIPDPLWKAGDSMDNMPPALVKMSYIVVIVDEFADLMMVAGKQIEELIARLTQKARAVGIHVILATQRPSVDVITGLIKSNIPSRIAFTVVQRNDSRTILDQNGAEALLGRGDMLYLGNGTTDLVRVHGAFMTDDEVRRVADDWRAREKPHYIDAILENNSEEETQSALGADDELDGLFDEVVEFVVSTGNTSTSSIQRRFRVGFNRAARIMDQLEEQGIVSAMQNGKREVLARHTD